MDGSCCSLPTVSYFISSIANETKFDLQLHMTSPKDINRSSAMVIHVKNTDNPNQKCIHLC